jgi:TPR repeat protein
MSICRPDAGTFSRAASPKRPGFFQKATTGLLAVILWSQAAVAGSASELIDGLIKYVMHDHAGAIEVLRPLADQGDGVAQETLGRIYLAGEGAKRDNIDAFKWFLLAAKQGRTEAQWELGRMYRDGIGISADADMAMFWFDRAAKQGSPAAYNAIGELSLRHPDVLQDAAAARGFFLSAASLDDAGAMYNLGLIYLVGRGVTQDEIEAYKWFELSARAAVGREHESALRALSSLSERLTPVQVKNAMAAASDWLQASRHSPF